MISSPPIPIASDSPSCDNSPIMHDESILSNSEPTSLDDTLCSFITSDNHRKSCRLIAAHAFTDISQTVPIDSENHTEPTIRTWLTTLRSDYKPSIFAYRMSLSRDLLQSDLNKKSGVINATKDEAINLVKNHAIFPIHRRTLSKL